MGNRPDFSEQQVKDAIRAGLREGRRPNRMSAGRAAERAETHRSILAHYQAHARQSLADGDYLQAAEKSWGAYAQTVKALTSDHRWRATHHASIIGVADQLATLASSADPTDGDILRRALSTAQGLHQHFYEGSLSDSTVTANAADVAAAIELMHELFSGNGAGADQSDGQSQ